jgi:hypothetical protein
MQAVGADLEITDRAIINEGRVAALVAQQVLEVAYVDALGVDFHGVCLSPRVAAFPAEPVHGAALSQFTADIA